METENKVYTYVNKDINAGSNKKSNWLDSVNDVSDIELEEVKVILPKVLVDRFKDAKTFVGEQPQYKLNSAYTISTRLSKFLLRYHKLCTRPECRLLNGFLNLPTIRKLMRDYDNGKESFDRVLTKIKFLDDALEVNDEKKKDSAN